MVWETSVAGRKPIATMGTLDPGQSALATQLQQMLAGVKSPEDYLSGMSSFLSDIPSMLPESIRNALEEAMKGKVSEEYYQSAVAAPAIKTFERDIAPRLREEHVGPGTFWGGARAESVGKGYSDLADSLAAARGGMAQEALQRGTQAALGYGGLLTQGVSDWMQAYIAANPSYADTIQSILAYLNTPTMLAYQDPEYIPSAIKDAMKKPKSYKEWIGGEYVDVGSHPTMQI